MYETIIIAVAAVTIFLEWRSLRSDTEAYRILFNFLSLFSALILMAIAVNISLAYAFPALYHLVQGGYAMLIFITILEIGMTLLFAMFKPLIPPRLRKALAWG